MQKRLEIEDVYDYTVLKGVEITCRKRRNKYLVCTALTFAVATTLGYVTTLPEIKDDLFKKVIMWLLSGSNFIGSCVCASKAGDNNLLRRRAKRQINELVKE